MFSPLSLKHEEAEQRQDSKLANLQHQCVQEYEEESIDFLGNIYSQHLHSTQHYQQQQASENIFKKEESYEELHFDKFEDSQFLYFPNQNALFHEEHQSNQQHQLAETATALHKNSGIFGNNSVENRRIVSTEWNKQHNYIEVGYYKEEQVIVLRNENAKNICGEQIEIQAEPSLTDLTTVQSLKHKDSSISSTSSSSSSQALIEEQTDIQVLNKQKHISLHLDYSSTLSSTLKDINCQKASLFCCSDYFAFNQEPSQSSTPLIQRTLISPEFLKFLTNQEIIKLTANTLALPLFSTDFLYFRTFENERKPFQIYQDIFKGIESFQEGQIVSSDYISFMTQDGFIFTAQCLWQVFPFRNENNLLVGCIIKENILVFDHILEEITQHRQSQLNKDEPNSEQPKIDSLQNEVLKLDAKHKQGQLEEEEDSKKKFEKSVRKFLYKFKYISKAKKIAQSKHDQDRFPQKTCKYRLLHNHKKSQSFQ